LSAIDCPVVLFGGSYGGSKILFSLFILIWVNKWLVILISRCVRYCHCS
jgi:hypothetical protein